jgi:hypothetical protein
MGKTFSTGLLTNGLWQDASNNIGIGGSPSGSYKFEVTGTGAIAGALSLTGATNKPLRIDSANGNAAYVGSYQNQTILSANRNPSTGAFTDTSKAAAFIALNANAADGNIVFATTATNNTEPTTRMTILSSGNVGIGVTNPITNLHIKGSTTSVIYAVGASNAYRAEYQVEAAGQFTGSFVANPSASSSYGGIGTSLVGITTSSTAFVIATSEVERMRITSIGRVGIGMTAPADLLSVSDNSPSMSLRYTSAGTTSTPVQANFYFRDFTGSGDIRGGIYFQDQSQSTSGCNMLLRVMNNSNTIITSINMRADGSVWNFNNSTTWQQSSDIKIKENIRPIGDALGKICALNPTHFEYKNKLGKTKTGFIAQEFEQVFAGHVAESYPSEEYAEYFEEGEMMKSIDADLIPYLVKAIQELSAKVSALENKS